MEKIMAFEKLIEQIGSLSVLELSDLVSALEKEFGVSAAMPTAAPAAGAASVEQAAPAEEKSEFKVTLQDGGPEKIKTIKALRQVTPLSLSDAKKAVEEAPTVLGESVPKDEAKKMKEVLEGAGAKVQLA